MEQSWMSYDPVAVIYHRLAAPHLFSPIAQNLVALLELPEGGRILDVGTGTGVGALAALKFAGPGSTAIGLDPSLEMLRQAQSKGLSWLVRGVVPGLPFRDDVFDGVLTNFVLNHITPYQAALSDMARVLHSRRRLGVSAWGPLQNEYRQLWRDLAESAVGKDVLNRALREVIPWEEWFSDPAHLRTAFQNAGLVKVEVHEREHTTSMAITDYLAMREISMQARFAREILGPVQWEQFRETVSDAFHARFREPIEDITVAYLCVGTKP